MVGFLPFWGLLPKKLPENPPEKPGWRAKKKGLQLVPRLKIWGRR
jgi:hypothetical protein